MITFFSNFNVYKENLHVNWIIYLKGGETNEAFIGEDEDISNVDEPVQSAALPWRRTDDDQNVPRAQDEFPPWINNEEYLPYTSPTNTVIGESSHTFSSKIPLIFYLLRRFLYFKLLYYSSASGKVRSMKLDIKFIFLNKRKIPPKLEIKIHFHISDFDT